MTSAATRAAATALPRSARTTPCRYPESVRLTRAPEWIDGDDHGTQDPRLVQPADRRADRLGPHAPAGGGPGGGRRRRLRPAVLGTAAAGGPAALHEARAAGDPRPDRRPRTAARARAGQADQRGLHHGVDPDGRRTRMDRRCGPADPRRRADPAAAGVHEDEEVGLLL